MSDQVRTRSKLLITTLVVLVVVALAATSAYLYYQYEKTRNNPQSEIENLVSRISKHMVLPQETPTLATVTDKTQLANQPFFAQAENDDKVLFFTNARLAILYRPSIDRIIAVSPLADEGTSATQSADAQQTAGIQQETTLTRPAKNAAESDITTIGLYNGSTTTGITQIAASLIQEKVAKTTVTVRENAAVQTYERTLVVDISGANTQKAQELARLFSAQVVSALPDQELEPAVDILIIVGNDFRSPASPAPILQESVPTEDE